MSNQDTAEEIFIIHHSKDGVATISNEDDDGPQPAKRQKLPICEILTTESYVSQIPRSPSVASESPSVAEYQEWPFQGFLKRITIGKEVTYNLEFKLSCNTEYPDIPIDPELLQLDREITEAASRAIPHPTIHRAAAFQGRKQRRKQRRKHALWTKEEDTTIIDMKKDGRSWEDIHTALPSHSKGSIQVHYSTKLKGRR